MNQPRILTIGMLRDRHDANTVDLMARGVDMSAAMELADTWRARPSDVLTAMTGILIGLSSTTRDPETRVHAGTLAIMLAELHHALDE